jgi:hypothetical protein
VSVDSRRTPFTDTQRRLGCLRLQSDPLAEPRDSSLLGLQVSAAVYAEFSEGTMKVRLDSSS